MRRLGAIIAGGKSRRFGSDKAVYTIDGVTLLDRVLADLRSHVDEVVVVGRDWPGLTRVEDAPDAGLGPLGGLCGALLHAQRSGFDGVLSAGCDTLPVPASQFQYAAAPEYIADQFLIGWWPSSLAPELADWLSNPENRSVRGWIAACKARAISGQTPLLNINTPQDVPKAL
jgi:molybdenum cofactor guanylyltransferase